MSEGQTQWLRLPCVHCGTEIPELIQGSTVKCFQCGTVNGFLEAKNLLDESCAEIFGTTLSIDFIEDPNQRIQTRAMRENTLGVLFSNLESEHLDKMGKIAVVATPLEKYPITENEVIGLCKRYNLIAVLVKNYVMPLALTQDEIRNASMIYYFCACRGFMLLGSFHTLKASTCADNQVAWSFYTTSSRNFMKMVDISKQAQADGIDDDRFVTFKTLGQAYASYAEGLSFISKGNPEWAKKQFDTVRTLLNEILRQGSDPRAKIDHAQAGMIVALQPSIETIFKEMNEGAMLRETIKIRSLPIDQSEKIITTMKETREVIERNEKRFMGIADFFLKLNFNQELEYLKEYRETFTKFNTELKEKYDKVLLSIVDSLINDYRFRIREVEKRMKIIAQAAKLPGETTKEEIREQRNELDMMERTLEPTLTTLFSLGYKEIKGDDYIKRIQPLLKESHEKFDNAVREAILELISDFKLSGFDISDALSSMIVSAKLDSGIAQQFQDARQELDSLNFAIAEIVDLSYSIERAEFSEHITTAMAEQHDKFDQLVIRAIYALIQDYRAKNQAIVLGMEPVINAAKLLGIEAVDEIVQAKADITALDALFDQVVGSLLSSSYDVHRGLFMQKISEVQAKRKADFTDQVRKATRSLLDFAGRGRKELADDRNKVVSIAENAMMQGDYKRAAENFEIAAKISSELGEKEKSTEYSERAKSMERLIF